MTWAHILSLSRVAAAVPIAVLILAGHGDALFWAAVIFAWASLTDLLDGPLARRGRTVGPFGIYLDTTGDKILVSIVLVAMVSGHLVDAWMAMLIVGREFLVTGIRTLGAVEGHVITANFAGKVKTTVTLVAMVFVLLVGCAREGGIGSSIGNLQAWWSAAWWATAVAVALTVYSGAAYLVDARPLFAATALKDPEDRPRPDRPA